ncbi:MAG: DUF1989 domain-containing protein [Actinobacteria bacterium]|nr:DUF1989 domain-containing protein [Actinomycetota bacterium]MBW3649735.1 DUF1989 domain-containing protein [Actinomycetota bacterium]
MPTVPASAATDLPDGVAPADVVWDETVDGWRYAAKALDRGTRLRLTDLDGEACAQLLLFNALATHERLNVADTAKVQWQAYLGTGALLLSDMGRVLATVVDDASGHHDLLCGAAHDRSRTVGDTRPPARALLQLGVARFGLERRDVHPCVNLLKGARVDDGDRLVFTGGAGAAAFVELRLELPALVVLANSPHVLDDRGEPPCTPLRVTAWRGEPAQPEDVWRTASPEGLRAFQNTEGFLLGHPLVPAQR